MDSFTVNDRAILVIIGKIAQGGTLCLTLLWMIPLRFAKFDYGGISISLEITQLNVAYLEKKHIFYETTAYQREFFVGGVCLVVIW